MAVKRYNGSGWDTVAGAGTPGAAGIVTSATAPSDTSVLWADTTVTTNNALIPAGGTTGQVLSKTSSSDYAASWSTPAGGKVLQVVVSANATNFQSIKTASATDVTNMSVTITPSATSSKILIMGMLNGINNQSTGTNAQLVELDLVNGSNTLIFRINGGQCLPYAYPQMNIPFTYLHSPASTSALTYKLRVTNDTSTYGIYVNNGNSNLTSSMVAMEIGA